MKRFFLFVPLLLLAGLVLSWQSSPTSAVASSSFTASGADVRASDSLGRSLEGEKGSADLIRGDSYSGNIGGFSKDAISSDLVVTAATALPGTFGKASPASGATNQATNVTLTWQASSGVNYYTFCLDQINDGGCNASWVNIGNVTSYSPAGLLAGKTYYWQVRAYNAGGWVPANGGTWWRFSTAAAPKPAAFGKSSPGSGATNQPTNVTLAWQASSAATSYAICIDSTNNGGCDATWVNIGNVTSYTKSWSAGMTYYWQVRAYNAAGWVAANNGTWWGLTTASPVPSPGSGKVYWGALLQNAAPPSSGNLAAGAIYDSFQKHAGKKMSIFHWGTPWKMNGAFLDFQTSYFENTRNQGAIPLVDWGSWELGYGANQPNFQLADIYNGAYDGFIGQWARSAAAWGHPFFIRFDWEMNGTWQFPWAEKLNGNRPGDYVKAWRRVHDIFRQNGATNATWVWCPNVASGTTTPMSSLYPGNSYVDWTCLDGYNKESTWLWFNQLFAAKGITWLHNSYQELLSIAPTKPIMIGETASVEAGDGGSKKAQWFSDTLKNQVTNYFPRIKAVLYYNWNDGKPFPIESTSTAQSAFASGIALPNYQANIYSNLNVSPIPEP